MDYITNAFSLNMVPPDCTLKVEPVAAESIPADAVSAVGHESTAAVLSGLLGRVVPAERRTIQVEIGDAVYLAAIFAADGKPFRPPEGKVLSVEDLKELRLEFRKVRLVPVEVDEVEEEIRARNILHEVLVARRHCDSAAEVIAAITAALRKPFPAPVEEPPILPGVNSWYRGGE